jgi:hypothetical protein
VSQTALSEAAAFAMVVTEHSRTRWGEVIGRIVVGANVHPGTPVWIVRRHARGLRARVVESEALPDGRVRLVLEGWGHEPLLPGHGVATNPELLTPFPTLAPELTLDRYVEYSGPPLPWTWGDWGLGVDGDVVVDLDHLPSEEDRANLERALNAWSNDGVGHGFGTGHIHGFGSGPHWSGSTLRWRMDFGSADVTQAANELARRLAGWSQQYGVRVASLRFRS